ncbi:MAG: autotransporter domain-containing protein [Desulfobacterales bacterium]|nr:autotransporter domain-containing protein [Desulfobacterales bacterium]
MFKTDYKSRFKKILKGGKVSLIASAFMIGSSVFADATVSTAITTQLTEADLNITVTSSGSITTTNNSSILLNTDLAEGQFILNNGTISASNNIKVAAIHLNPTFSNNGTITNNGTLITSFTGTVYNDADGILIGLHNNGTITNNGTIQLSGTTTNPFNGILIGDGDNTGTITNNAGASIIMNAVNVYGISIAEDNSGTVANNGNITLTSTNEALGMEVGWQNNDNTGTITNGGNIDTTASTGTAYGIKLYQHNSGIIRNESGGIINATGSTAAYGIYSAGNNSGTIENSGTIQADINGTLDAAAYSIKENTIHTASGTITNQSSGKLYGNISTGDALDNYGIIELPWNANGADKANINTFANKTNGKLTIGLNTGSDGVVTNKYSQLESADISIESGSTIDVNVLTASSNYSLLEGKTLDDVILATNSLTAPDSLTVTDNSAVLTFSYIKDGNTIDLGVERISYETITQESGGNAPAKSVAAALDTINTGTPTTAMSDLLGEIDALSTGTSVADATSSLAPHIMSGINGAANQIVTNIQQIIDIRQAAALKSGINSGDVQLKEKNIWAKPFASRGSQDDKNDINGFDINAYGLGIGLDGKNKNDIQTGLGFFYTRADVEVNNVDQDSDLDVFTILGYGNIPLAYNMNLMYQASYAWQKTDTSRALFNGDTAEADFTANTFVADLKLSKDYQTNPKLILRPTIAFTYKNHRTPAYEEKGAAGANLSVNENRFEEYILGLGSTLDYQISDDSKFFANVNVGYDLKGDVQESTASFIEASGTNFSTTGVDNGRWEYKFGIGYEKTLKENNTINFFFEHKQEGTDFRNDTIYAKYVYAF